MIEKKSVNKFIQCGCIVCCLCLLAWGMFHVLTPATISTSQDSQRKIPIYCVETTKPQVAISFDAAWGNEDTQIILDILAANQVKTTFFMTGGWISAYPEDVKKIAAAGHDLGNHSETHKQMSQLDAATCTTEIQNPHDQVKELTGVEMCLFRPPYGDYNNQLITVANNLNYHVIQWSVDSLDWKDYGKENIVDTVLNHKNLKDGAIILMHNGAKYTKDALPEIINGLKKKGFDIVPISQLIYTENYYTDHEGCQHQK